jgi:alkanesulfonate monooxygenase SsuD/methylene tetrahydromethanopterin reductase-like flavin-dependent oxidoreductase (luciferase family)
MGAYPEDEGLAAGYTSVLFSNKFFDPVEGSRLYQERLAEYRLAEDVGFDGIMVNEHHNAPYCMQPRITVWSSILAAVTERVKIVQLGNPLPTYDSPVQFAEEIAMIDMISKGRLVSGIVRGAGQEQICVNANPAYNRERFDEALRQSQPHRLHALHPTHGPRSPPRPPRDRRRTRTPRPLRTQHPHQPRPHPPRPTHRHRLRPTHLRRRVHRPRIDPLIGRHHGRSLAVGHRR